MSNIGTLVTTFLLLFSGVHGKPQHIIFILADDMGFNDVSFHGSNEIPTTNIDALCYGGIILNNHYTLPLCTPARTALLTGRYPIHLGMQHSVLKENEPRGLPLSANLLPEYLRNFNYVNRIVGKWHLGFYKKIYTPVFRGFHSHYGYYTGGQDYYNHMSQSNATGDIGLSMYRNLDPDWKVFNKYATRLYTEEAVSIIHRHDVSRPLFLFLSHPAPHAGNENEPLQAPPSRIQRFSHIQNRERRIYAAMVSELDDSVGSVMMALAKKRMLEDSIVVFLSDNGAPVEGFYENHGSNWPFKGQKNTPFEGAVRTPACVWSKRFQSNRRISSQLMHVADWLPTFYSVAGGDVRDLDGIDGFDMLEALSKNLESPRKEVLINIDEKVPYAALRVGNLKYIEGTTDNGNYDRWFEPDDQDNLGIYDVSAVYRSKSAQALSSAGCPLPPNILELRSQSQVHCGSRNEQDRQCNPLSSPCLFDLENDPCEHNNVYGLHAESDFIVEKFRQYNATLVPAANTDLDPLSNPIYWNCAWTFWRDFTSDPDRQFSNSRNARCGRSQKPHGIY